MKKPYLYLVKHDDDSELIYEDFYMSNKNCEHDHSSSWFTGQIKHLKDNWLGCLLGCLLTHVLFSISERIFQWI